MSEIDDAAASGVTATKAPTRQAVETRSENSTTVSTASPVQQTLRTEPRNTNKRPGSAKMTSMTIKGGRKAAPKNTRTRLKQLFAEKGFCYFCPGVTKDCTGYISHPHKPVFHGHLGAWVPARVKCSTCTRRQASAKLMCIACRLAPDHCKCSLEAVQAAKHAKVGPHDVWQKLRTVRQRRVVYAVLCATCSKHKWVFARMPELTTRWPQKYCQVCQTRRSLGLQVCMRCALTVAACRCREARASTAVANGESSEATEGPGFVSVPFRSNCALLLKWVTDHAGEFPLRDGRRANEKALSQWIHHMRQASKAGCLNRTQRQLLDSIPGLAAQVPDSMWERRCAELRAWLEKHQRKNANEQDEWIYPRKDAENEYERQLGNWLHNNRKWQRAAKSTKDHFDPGMRQKHLEALPGWSSRQIGEEEKRTFACAGPCGRLLDEASFTENQRQQGCRRKCIDCCQSQGRPRSETQKCEGACQKELSKDMFAIRQWHRNERICKTCTATTKKGAQKRTSSQVNQAQASERPKKSKKK